MVHFPGRLSPDEVRERLLRADVFVLASAWEGMPGSALEAMAVGLPVVATDVTGTNEVVVHGETGLLVPPDDPVALATALATMLTDAGLCRSLGAAARRRVAAVFSVDRLVRERTTF
jgi:glycosyltransferase involved in cell wall biosynthesis